MPPGGPYAPGGAVPPGGPVPGAPYGPPRRRGGGGKVLGCLVVGFVVFVLLCAGGYGIYLQRTSHTLSAPSSAGGMSRDTAAEAKIDDAVNRLGRILSEASGYKVHRTVSAVYGLGKEKYLFIGGTGDHRLKYPEQDFNRAVMGAFTGIEKTVYSPSTIKLSDAGGDGVGLFTTIQVQIITSAGTRNTTGYMAAWSTRTTMGIVMPIGEPSGSIDVPSVMRRIRADVED
ncbi:hypothetical protein SAMN05443665_103437 [Actinomadura meyerae]|uniref:Uncharacterized protein n=1 Tax=Actinomadura meyerae TaxID=240840 RepID=A0A239N0X4_9ACTN|nr:hypothetical protein SAMN05443665_103437 [Actinomadura meyerae]